MGRRNASGGHGVPPLAASCPTTAQEQAMTADTFRMQPRSADQDVSEEDLRLLLEQGRILLRSLGQRDLAREFWNRGHGITNREALIRLLLDCLPLRERP